MATKADVLARLAAVAESRDNATAQLTQRADERKAMTDAHLAAVAALEKQIADLQETHRLAAEWFDAATAGLTTRKNELQSDYSTFDSFVKVADAAGVFNVESAPEVSAEK